MNIRCSLFAKALDISCVLPGLTCHVPQPSPCPPRAPDLPFLASCSTNYTYPSQQLGSPTTAPLQAPLLALSQPHFRTDSNSRPAVVVASTCAPPTADHEHRRPVPNRHRNPQAIPLLGWRVRRLRIPHRGSTAVVSCQRVGHGLWGGFDICVWGVRSVYG